MIMIMVVLMILAMVIMMTMIMMVMMMIMGVVLNNFLLQPKPFVKVFENYKTDYLLLSTTTNCWCLQRCMSSVCLKGN